MARQYQYNCNTCDFNILTNEEGSNALMRGTSRLYKCSNCSELVNHFVSLRDIKTFTSRLKDVPERCPKCKTAQSLERWNPSQGCPKCGGKLEKDLTSIIMTD